VAALPVLLLRGASRPLELSHDFALAACFVGILPHVSSNCLRVHPQQLRCVPLTDPTFDKLDSGFASETRISLENDHPQIVFSEAFGL
jgi:hypothetical protein